LDVAHFKRLLDKTDSIITNEYRAISYQDSLLRTSGLQIQTLININQNLSKQIGILSGQYSLSQLEQKKITANAELVQSSNEEKFYLATKELQLSVFNPPTSRDLLINNISIILESQLTNPYLLSNRHMFHEWVTVKDSLDAYRFQVGTLPKNPNDVYILENGETINDVIKSLERQWRNCFNSIGDLSNNLQNFMRYYRDYIAGRVKNGPKPDDNFYLKLLQLQKSIKR
jgi:hypothetical protein